MDFRRVAKLEDLWSGEMSGTVIAGEHLLLININDRIYAYADTCPHQKSQLQRLNPEFAVDSREMWQTDALWQPLRELVERLLVAYDWAESFVALNLVVKPLIDELFMKHVSDLALAEEDYLLGQIFYSLNADCQWHREWSVSLVRTVLEDDVRNRETIQAWIRQWYPLASRAVDTIAIFLQDNTERGKTQLRGIKDEIDNYYDGYLRSLHLETTS